MLGKVSSFALIIRFLTVGWLGEVGEGRQGPSKKTFTCALVSGFVVMNPSV